MAVSFPLGKILERTWDNSVTDKLNLIGGLWLSVLNYLFLLLLLKDLGFVIFKWIDKESALSFLQNHGKILFYFIIGFSLSITLLGYLNANTIRVKKINLSLNKELKNQDSYKIAMFSDLHLGAIIGEGYLQKIISKINKEDVDLVLIAGDLVDGEMKPVFRKNLGTSFNELNAKYGIYSINGNHELMGNADLVAKHFENFGVKYLINESVLINDDIWITGRNDADSRRFSEAGKVELKGLLSKTNPNQFNIVLDHQPVRILETAENNVDLLLCGHTHHGQLFPLNFITQAAFKVSWGLKKFDNTHVYVSCGVGSWGPPVRVGNRPEVVFLEIGD